MAADLTSGKFQSPYSSIITDGSGGKDDAQRKKLIEDLDEQSSLLRRTMRAAGIFQPADMDFNSGFYRFPRNDPYNYVDGAREYLFFTKPDLPLLNQNGDLLEETKKVTYFNDLFSSPGYKKSIFGNLCASHGGDPCPFMKILSNRKTSNMDLPDINVEEMETAVNMFGSKIYYPKSSMSSDENVDFSIEFEDTKFAEVYHLFKSWDYYRQLKWLGIMGPGLHAGDDNSSYSTYNKYCYYKILYDHISVFKFLVSTDGNTILFMAKGTGVYPKSISRSSFSEVQDRGPLKVTVGFKISGWLEDSTPNIVGDFNTLVWNWKHKEYWKTDGSAAALWDDEIGAISQEMMECPFIYRDYSQANKFNTYKLLWAPKEAPTASANK